MRTGYIISCWLSWNRCKLSASADMKWKYIEFRNSFVLDYIVVLTDAELYADEP